MLLVTGITGHSGKYFLQELIKNKYQGPIRCIIRETSDVMIIDKSELEIEKVVGVIEDEAFLDRCMKGVDTVVHIAGIQKTLDVINASVNNNVRRAIVVHTTGIYSNYKSASQEYKEIELEMNEIIKTHKMNITILRPTMIYGDLKDLNMSKFIKMVYKLRVFPVINHKNSLIQPVNARDLGKAYYQVLTKPMQELKAEYILSGEKPITMLDAFKLISSNLGKKTLFIMFPLEIGVLIARALKLVTFRKIDYIERVQRMGEDRSFSHDHASRDFEYSPMSFGEGIKIEVNQFKNR